MGHHMGQTDGSQVNVSLDLVDHSIHVGYVAPLLRAEAPVSASHTSVSSWTLADKRQFKTDGKRKRHTTFPYKCRDI